MDYKENKKKLFVASLSFKIRDNHLYDIFITSGQVVSAKIVMDQEGKSRGYGFVEMATEQEAATAIEQLNGTVHFGRTIVVHKQKPKPVVSTVENNTNNIESYGLE